MSVFNTSLRDEDGDWLPCETCRFLGLPDAPAVARERDPENGEWFSLCERHRNQRSYWRCRCWSCLVRDHARRQLRPRTALGLGLTELLAPAPPGPCLLVDEYNYLGAWWRRSTQSMLDHAPGSTWPSRYRVINTG